MVSVTISARPYIRPAKSARRMYGLIRQGGSAHKRRCTHNVGRTQGGAHKRRSVATAGVLLFKGGVGAGPRVERSGPKQGGVGGPHTRRCTHKEVHTEGGAHKRRSVATAGVLLFKGGAGAGPRVERSEPERGGGGCTHKAVHTQGGLWPPHESCYLRGVRGLAPASSEASRRKGGACGPKTSSSWGGGLTDSTVHSAGRSGTPNVRRADMYTETHVRFMAASCITQN